jgi:iron complex transport system substrate-binding protein
LRIVSLLPSATEMLFALGLGDSIAGVTHECDFPPEAADKRVVVRPRISGSLSEAEIDRLVSEYMARHESLYSIDVAAMKEIQPDLVVTQDLCHVCAASPDDLGAALAVLPRAPRVLSLTPQTLSDVWDDIRRVGEATGHVVEAEEVVSELRKRVASVARATANVEARPRTVCLEWLDPPYACGHWVPEMVALAGGEELLGKAGEPSFRVRWEDVLAAQPEVIVITLCGYNLEQVEEQFAKFTPPPGWQDLPAVRSARVFCVDATSYFSRPGPRLADGVEILAHILHPERAPADIPANSARAASRRQAGAAA